MKCIIESELMKNQKHADVMAPDVAFDVIQAPNGDSIFFSIGTDHVFYVTRELRASQTGWTKLDLSTGLSQVSGGPVKAKAFAVSQNATTQAFDLALVVTTSHGSDSLFLSFGHPNNSDAWNNPISWTAVPFDADGVTPPSPLTIADVYLMNLPSASGGSPVENCFVDIIRNPSDQLHLLDRYYIKSDGAKKWVRHLLAVDLKAGSIFSCLGRRPTDVIPGIYTFGAIGNTQELIYSPQYNRFRPAFPPPVSRLVLPPATTSIASCLNSAGFSNLFVAAPDGIHLFAPQNQLDQAKSLLIVPTTIVASQNILGGVTSLTASTVGSRTVIWGINAARNLFQVYCKAGSESNPSSWSSPVTLCTGVEGFAFYLNLNAANNVLFAHLSGQKLLQFTQDPVTTSWSSRAISLPPTSPDDVIEFNSFTTQITVQDDNGVPSRDSVVSLTSTSPVSVYVNNMYQILTPTVPINERTNDLGAITIIQEVQSLCAVGYQVQIAGDSSSPVNIDPLSKAMQKLSCIKSGDDMANIQIKSEDGTTKPLVPASVSSNTRNTVAGSIVQLLQVRDTLPSNNPGAVSSISAQPSQPYHSMALLQSTDNPIFVAIGDLVAFVREKWDLVEHYVIQKLEEGYHFILKLGDQVYAALLDSVSAVVMAIENALNWIKVQIEDLISWLGFLFDWDDIKRTHLVLGNMCTQIIHGVVDVIPKIQQGVDSLEKDMENSLSVWAGITDPEPKMTIAKASQASSGSQGSNTPQTLWAIYHTDNGLGTSECTPNLGSDLRTDLDKMLQDIENILVEEGEAAVAAYKQFKDQVWDQPNLSPIEVCKKLIGIIGDLALRVMRTMLVNALDILKILIEGVFEILNTPLNIPVISKIYEDKVGRQLTIFDVMVFAGAITTTIFFKLLTHSAPFEDDARTQALINAPDLMSFMNVFWSSPAKPTINAITNGITPHISLASTHNRVTARPQAPVSVVPSHSHPTPLAISAAALSASGTTSSEGQATDSANVQSVADSVRQDIAEDDRNRAIFYAISSAGTILACWQRPKSWAIDEGMEVPNATILKVIGGIASVMSVVSGFTGELFKEKTAIPPALSDTHVVLSIIRVLADPIATSDKVAMKSPKMKPLWKGYMAPLFDATILAPLACTGLGIKYKAAPPTKGSDVMNICAMTMDSTKNVLSLGTITGVPEGLRSFARLGQFFSLVFKSVFLTGVVGGIVRGD